MTAIDSAALVVVDLLVRRHYDTIEKLTAGRRLSGQEMRSAVESYGRELVRPGDGWWDTVEITPVQASDPPAFHVAAPLWTREEGRSDLTLELRLLQAPNETYDTEVLDIHVL